MAPALREGDARGLVYGPTTLVSLLLTPHYYAHDLAGAKGPAGGNANTGAADFDPSSPTGSVIHIGVEGIVQLTDRAADHQSGTLCGSVSIVGDRPAQRTVGGPIVGRPRSAEEFRAVDHSRVVGLTKAGDFAAGVHGRAIRVASRRSTKVEETLPSASGIAIRQGYAVNSDHGTNYAARVVGRATGGRDR